jgi:hypothetical protein
MPISSPSTNDLLPALLCPLAKLLLERPSQQCEEIAYTIQPLLVDLLVRQLNRTEFISPSIVGHGFSRTYICCVLVGLQNYMQHLSSFLAHLTNQTLSNRQESWESGLNNLIKIGSVFP